MEELTKGLSMMQKITLGSKMKNLTDEQKDEIKKGMKNAFEKNDAKKYIKKTDKEHQLKFYGLMQQLTRGDNYEKEPFKIAVVKHKKWEAWNNYKGLEKKRL